MVEEVAGKGFRRGIDGQWQPLDFRAFAFALQAYPESTKDLVATLGKAFLATGVFPLS